MHFCESRHKDGLNGEQGLNGEHAGTASALLCLAPRPASCPSCAATEPRLEGLGVMRPGSALPCSRLQLTAPPDLGRWVELAPQTSVTQSSETVKAPLQ